MASKSRSGGIAVAVALALIAPLAAAGIWVFAKSSESPLESASAVEPLVGSVERAERFQEASVAVAVTFATALSPAINASGTLTALTIAPASEVKTGTVVGSVNNQQIVAYTSKAPLFQDIYKGLKGADVKTAQQLLKDLGFYSGPIDGDAGAGTEKSIMAFNKHYGWGKDNGTLSLASLIWAGQAPVTVATVPVALGAQVGPGTALFTTTASLAAITVTETPNLPTDGDVTLTVNGVVDAVRGWLGQGHGARRCGTDRREHGHNDRGRGHGRLGRAASGGHRPQFRCFRRRIRRHLHLP